jgi:hypothetical protein
MHHYGYPKREVKPTIKVLMLRDAVGAPDGITRTEYSAGQEYDLPEDLAGCFFSTGHADPAEAHTQPETASPKGPAERELSTEPDTVPQIEKTRPRPPRARGKA